MNTSININELEQTGLIRLAQMEPELEYIFRHALVQEAAYDSILKVDRKNLHLAVAREMERLYPERLDELAALLANHYREAGEKQKALEYYRRAARYAFDKFANSEAEYNLRAALELCADELERAEICHYLGIVVQTIGRADDAEKFLRDSLPTYRANNKREEIADVYCHISQGYWAKNDMSNYLAAALEGLKEAGELPPSAAYARLLFYVANSYLFNDRLDEAETANARALSTAEKCNAKSALAQTLATQGLIEDKRGRHEKAIENYKRAIAFAEESHDTLALSRARNNLANVLIKLGRSMEAVEQYQILIEFSRQIHTPVGEIWALSQLNNLYLDIGEIEKAAELLPLMQTLLELTGGKTYRTQVEQAIFQTLIYSGQTAEVKDALIENRARSVEHNDKQMIINGSFFIATALWLEGDCARAAEELDFGIKQSGAWGEATFQFLLAALQARSQQDISIARATLARGEAAIKNAPNFLMTVNRLYALMHIRAREGAHAEAMKLAAEVTEKYRAGGFRWLYSQILHEAGDLAREANDIPKARELYQQALSEFESMHLTLFAEQARAKLIQVS